jgi:hypothetical protein
MKALLDDLVVLIELSWAWVSIARANVDLAAAFADELEELRGAHPGRLDRAKGGRRHSGGSGTACASSCYSVTLFRMRSSMGRQTRRSVWC